MTITDLENQHIDRVNQIIDINNAIGEVWSYHPENPNQIDPVSYHALLVAKLEKMERELKEFEERHFNV